MLDKIDLQILAILQEDLSTPISFIAEKVSLSNSPCWRRIQRLEKEGFILKNVALLNAKKMGLGVTVFVSIKTNNHSQEWFKNFQQVIMNIPEVLEFYRMSGEVDYFLKVVVSNVESYDVVYKKLINNTDLFDVSSSFAMEEMKYSTALPLKIL